MGRFHNSYVLRYAIFPCLFNGKQYTFVVLGHDLYEPGLIVTKFIQDFLRDRALCILHMSGQKGLDGLEILIFRECFKVHHVQITAYFKITGLIEDVSDTPGHPGGKITTGTANDNDPATGHVFTTMISDSFHYSHCTAVSYGKTFSGDAAEIGLASGGTIQQYVTDKNVLFRDKGGMTRRVNDDLAARQTLAKIINFPPESPLPT